jgi:opacity protein-like surface antigen
MKKFLPTTALIFFVMICQAQWFVGGNIGYHRNSEEQVSGRNNSVRTVYSEFSFAPTFGYQDNRLAFGATLSFLQHSTKSQHWSGGSWVDNTDQQTKFPLWGIQPFVRYTFVEFGKFSVYANLGMHFLKGKTEREYTYLGWPPYTVMVPYNVNSFGINMTPILSYNLSERISLEASLNFMNFGWNKMESKHDDKNRDEKMTERNFGIGINSGNVADVGAISIGFVYKFRESESPKASYDNNRSVRERRRSVVIVPSLDRLD